MNTGLKNDVIWSEIESGFGEPGGTPPPPRIPMSIPRLELSKIPFRLRLC